MSVFRPFEVDVIKALAGDRLPDTLLADVLANAKLSGLQHTGVGYFLTVCHPDLPEERTVCDTPTLYGEHQQVTCGFVVFIERHELMLECHSWGDGEIPHDFRNQPIAVSVAM